MDSHWNCRGVAGAFTLNGLEPLVVATEWGYAGAASLTIFLTIMSVASLVYWRVLMHAPLRSISSVLLVSGGGLTIAWLSPILFSSDVYAYAAYGEMARVGLNAYAPATAHDSDLLIRAAQAQWITAFPICVYGTGFLAITRWIVTAVAPFGLLATLDAFRVLACAAFFGCVAVAYYAYRGDAATRLRAAATIGLNPVAIWCAAEGHNDALALMVVLSGFALVAQRRVAFGTAVMALSALVKPQGVLAAIAASAVNPRARLGAALGVGIAAIFSLPLMKGIATELAPHGHYAPQASLQGMLAPLGAVPALAVALVVAGLLVQRGTSFLRCDDDQGWIWLGLSVWVLIPNPYPWYALWLIALAAIAPRSRPARVAMLLSFTALLRYIPDAVGIPAVPIATALGIVCSLPLAGLLPLRPWYNQQLA